MSTKLVTEKIGLMEDFLRITSLKQIKAVRAFFEKEGISKPIELSESQLEELKQGEADYAAGHVFTLDETLEMVDRAILAGKTNREKRLANS